MFYNYAPPPPPTTTYPNPTCVFFCHELKMYKIIANKTFPSFLHHTKHVSEHLEPKKPIKKIWFFFSNFQNNFPPRRGGGHPSVENSTDFIFFLMKPSLTALINVSQFFTHISKSLDQFYFISWIWEKSIYII